MHRKSLQGVRLGTLRGAGCPSTSDVVARRAPVGCYDVISVQQENLNIHETVQDRRKITIEH